MVIEMGQLLIASTLGSSTWIPSPKTTGPRKTTWVVKSLHFSSLAYGACCLKT